MSDQQFAIALAVFGLVVSAIITYLLNKNQRPKKSAHFFIKDFDLVSRDLLNNIEEIEIRFHSLLVDELRIARFWVWNSGDIALRGSDVSGGDKLKIIVPGAEHISMLEVHQSMSRVDVKCELVEDGVSIEFDTIDKDDFFVGRFVYSVRKLSDRTKDNDPKLVGSIAGVSNGIEMLNLEEYFKETHWSGKILAFSMLIYPVSFVFLGYGAFEIQENVAELGVELGRFGQALPYATAFLGVLILFVGVLYHISWRRVARVKVPARLRRML
ncbi:MAG: hypothetical protein APF82_06865 [Sphingomonadales bacterium BRH_c42]|nr:MAG: hypothetical protein APF82_06865 [Sphingomonadales bacterium BRH_c42]